MGSKKVPMKKILLLLSFLFLLLCVTMNSLAVSMDTYVIVLPGSFYLSINGALQDGIVLSGLKPADSVTNQVGYWNSDNNMDYLYYYDSSSVPGFRIQMYLDSDFEYTGNYSEQEDISVDNFLIFSSWDSLMSEGGSPSVGVDNPMKTLNIVGVNSCKPDAGLPYSDYYYFNSDFLMDPYFKSFSLSPFDYLVSTNSCKNEGKISIGRFQLNLGIVKAGEYKSSLFIMMLDGY